MAASHGHSPDSYDFVEFNLDSINDDHGDDAAETLEDITDAADTIEDSDDVTEAEADKADKAKRAAGALLSPATLIKDRHNNSMDTDTVPADRLDADVLIDDAEKAGVDRSRSGTKLLRLVDSDAAKKQIKANLAAEKKGFDLSILKIEPPKAPPVPANDNVSWPLMDQLTRPTFEQDEQKRWNLIKTAHHLRGLGDLIGADALGISVHPSGKDNASVDHDMQHTKSGGVIYNYGQMLDRKPRKYGDKNGETDAVRHDGPVRTSKSGPVNSGFDVYRDDPFAQRKIDARIELEDIIAAVGPDYWVHARKAILGDDSFTGIGEALGYHHSQAPAAGSVIVKIALEAATKFLAAKRNKISYRDFVQTDGFPVAARRHIRALNEAEPGQIAA